LRPEPGRSTQSVRTSVPPRASLPRESSSPSQHVPRGAWSREPAQAGRGTRVARAEAVRRSGVLGKRSSGSPGHTGVAVQARQGKPLGNADGVATHRGRDRRRTPRTERVATPALDEGCAAGRRAERHGARRRDRAERDDVVGRASGTRPRCARYTTLATEPRAGSVRRAARFDRGRREATEPRKRGGGSWPREVDTARRAATMSYATAPTRTHRGDREGNLQGRRGGAGEATHVERRVRRGDLRVEPADSSAPMTFARTSGKRVQDGL